MSLVAGARIGPFVIVAPLGAGGMGEVYRASDTKLGRDVALKILPEGFAGDPERLARFEREARMLASLNHSLIAQIYGVEEGPPPSPGDPPVRALVMELVDGEDLAQRLQRGPLPVRQAVAFARQIAEALDAAHELGVVHRDLKPGNIRIRHDGAVKLLDFGLAKPNDAGTSGFDAVLENSPTISSPAITERGVILGTAAYMAPEQAQGKVVDKRADVWALGVVFYEMITGRRPFSGGSSTEIIAQILEREPDWTALPNGTPAHVCRLLKRCLQKDRKLRMRDCGDVMFELGDAPIEAPPRRSSASRFEWGIAAAIGIAVGVSVAMLGSPRGAAPPAATDASVERFAFVQERNPIDSSGRLPIAVSRDGRKAVFTGNQQLFVRRVDELRPRPISGTEPVTLPRGERGNTGFAIQPMLSPDGESVAYSQGGQLKRIAVIGGAPAVICECDFTYGGTWSDDNTILFSSRAGRADNGIWRVPAGGGTPERVIAIQPEEIALRPQLLPGGRHVLFTVTRGAHWNQSNIVVQALDSKDRQVLVEGGIDGRYVTSGHLVYGRDGVIHAVKFDPSNLQVSGSAAPVLSGVSQQTAAGAWGGFAYAISGEGTLVYVPEEAAAIKRVMVWIDRAGREERLPAEPRAYQYPRLSPDGQHVALDLRDQQNDVWSWDLSRATLTPVTRGRFAGGPASWNRAGDGVIYAPDVDGVLNLHALPISGGAPRRLSTSAKTQAVNDLTPDGQWVVTAENDAKTGLNLLLVSADGSRDPKDLLSTPFNEMNADVSPDGRWIAYQTDESGRYEVFVRPFPDLMTRRWLVSRAGGTRPLWSRDGRELFFLDADRRMTAVSVRQSPTLEFGVPQTLFETAQLGLEGQQRNFDLSPDGKRFLMVRNLPPPADAPALVLIQNWFAALRERVR